jgi:large subunit ribosomal protein L21
MKYAVIELQGKQYRVQEGQKLVVDRFDQFKSDQEKLMVDKVLLIRDQDEVKVGQPFVEGAKVTLSLVNQQKGPKIQVRQYKAKSRYRRQLGHRQLQTVFEVSKISA